MNSNQIKYIIFSGPIGSGKTTQMSYFGSKYKEFTVIETLDPINQPNLCLKEGGLPDIYAYSGGLDNRDRITEHENVTREHGILFIVLLPKTFEMVQKRLDLEQTITKSPINIKGLDHHAFNDSMKLYRDFKNFVITINLNVENIEVNENDSIVNINRKVEEIVLKYGIPIDPKKWDRN